MTDHLQTLVENRRRRRAELGPDEGAALPAKRETPLSPFMAAPGVICEIKRRSPSEGDIAPGLDAVEQARRYAAAGACALSVLTEASAFGGSLADLLAVKRAFPDLPVLRKDFLLDEDDLDAAWRAGADAALLIARMHSGPRLAALHARARALGMETLVELRDARDVAKARPFAPRLVGINSRDLATFAIDPLHPLRIKALVDWPADVVYESGVRTPERAAWAASSGFFGLLAGTAAVRDPALPARLRAAWRGARPMRFWPELARALNRREAEGGGPLVKFCGFTRVGDVRRADELGADLLGFVFAETSKRRAPPGLLGEAAAAGGVSALRVGVVAETAGQTALPPEVEAALAEGRLDAVQFHGSGTPADCARLCQAHYQAAGPGHPARAPDGPLPADFFAAPRVLLDAGGAGRGGTGERIPEGVLDQWRGPLWLAGGLTPDNVCDIIIGRHPELLDAAGGVESSPGVKDHKKMEAFLRAVRPWNNIT